jgi:hypothetical protein
MEIFEHGQNGKIGQDMGRRDAVPTRAQPDARTDGGAGVSSLDISSLKSPQKSLFPPPKPRVPLGLFAERRQKHVFWLLKGGFELARINSESVRFLTLTTSDDSTRDIHASFEKFVKRVRREFKRFEYACVREWTVRGYPHLHVLFRGCFIPQKWISETWADLHSSCIVDIRKVSSIDSAVNYLMKYLVKDGNCIEGHVKCSDGVIRDLREARRLMRLAKRDGVALQWTCSQRFRAFWYSSGWIFKGARKAWRLIIKAWIRQSGFYADEQCRVAATEGEILPFQWVIDQWRKLLSGEYLVIGGRAFHVSDGELREFL